MSRYEKLDSIENARRALAWPLDRPIIVTVRRLAKAKGLENLVSAINLIREHIPDILLMIVGSGPLEGRLRQQIVDEGIENHARLVGYVSEQMLPSAYRAANLHVVPTLALEGFGLIVVEALACGTRTLVTPVGGLPEVVANLGPGLVFDSTKPSDIASGISAALLGNTVLPSQEACREHARLFDWPLIARRVNEIYAEVV